MSSNHGFLFYTWGDFLPPNKLGKIIEFKTRKLHFWLINSNLPVDNIFISVDKIRVDQVDYLARGGFKLQ